MTHRLLVIGEMKDQSIRHVTYEAIAAARKISEVGEIIGLLCGSLSLERAAQEMISYGADRVICIEDDSLKNYTSDGYGQSILSMIESIDPIAIVMGHTAIGKDLTPHLASKLGSGLVSDVINIQHEGKEIAYIRPIYSGKAFEKKVITNGIQFITIRPNNIKPFHKDDSRTGEVVTKHLRINPTRVEVKDVIHKQLEGIDLSEASVVIAGGRGVKSKEGFQPLYELADLLGGAVGASRGACDADYCDYSLQIGQTGKVVTPDLYIAAGISGAIQHVSGMSHSKVIVAINEDADANIFDLADYGIVGDLFTVIPKLIEELKKDQRA